MAVSVSVPVGVTLGSSNVVFNFNGDYTVGQFANGDWWVVGGAGRTITSITPACTSGGSGTWNDTTPFSNAIINGATINAGCGTDAIGTINTATDPRFVVLFGRNLSPYDNRVYPGHAYNTCAYDARLNCDPGATGQPLSMATPISITKAVGIVNNPAPDTVISDFAVLTVLASAPAAGSFRPATSTADKTILYNTSQMDFSLLPGFDKTLITNKPTLAQGSAIFNRWFQLGFLDLLTGENMYAANSYSGIAYGRQIAWAMSQAYATLLMNYTQAELTPIYIGILQFGIDVIGRVLEGASAIPDTGGGNMNWKFPVILCALNFKTANAISMASGASFKFPEDRMVFPVTQLHTTAKASYYPQYSLNNGALGYAVNDILYDNDPNFDGLVRGSVKVTNICANGKIGNSGLGGTGGLIPNPLVAADYNVQPRGYVSYSGGSGAGLTVILPRFFDRYTGDQVDTPDWSSSHMWSGGTPTNMLGIEGQNWQLGYRDICSYGFLGGTVAALNVTGGRAAWNNPLFFEYMDRLWDMEGAPDFPTFQASGFANNSNKGSDLERELWTKWRGSLAGSTANIVETAAFATAGVTNYSWVRFDYCLSRRTPPDPSNFTVFEITGGVPSIKTISSVSIFGRAIRIFTTTPFGAGNTVQINYTQPVTNPVRDLRGNLIPSFVQYTIAVRKGNFVGPHAAIRL